MRKSFLVVGFVALLTGACSSSTTGPAPAVPAATNGAPAYYGPTPQPYRPTQAPYRPTPPPAAGAQSSPYDGVTYADPGVNPSVDPARDHLSTFGLDVDTASYAVARRYIADGNLPDPASVRVEEFVNSFDQGYAPPLDNTFAIYADGGPSPFLGEDETLLRIGIKARDETNRTRPAAALTFVVDVSGSMGREDRLELVKWSLAQLVVALRPDDQVGIVVFGSDARVVLPPTAASQRDAILGAIQALRTEGSTNTEAGLRLGYAMARSQFREGGINRVVLASDGVANVGSTDADSILRRVREDSQPAIQLITVGFGMGNYNDALMEQLADHGDGFYAYVNTQADARKLFLEDLTGTLDTVALDARVQVDFNTDAVASYRLIGYENRAIPDGAFRNDNVQAGAIGAGHAVTALYAVRLTSDGGATSGVDGRNGSTGTRLATVSLRWTDPDSSAAREIAVDVRSTGVASSLRDTSPTFQLDALVAATAEHFRASDVGRGYRLGDVLAVADESAESLPQTAEVHDFLDFLRAAANLER